MSSLIYLVYRPGTLYGVYRDYAKRTRKDIQPKLSLLDGLFFIFNYFNPGIISCPAQHAYI